MNDETVIMLILVAVAAIAIFAGVQYVRRLMQEWQGKVTDKDTRVRRHNNRNRRRRRSGISINSGTTTTIEHYIWVETDEGKEIKWKVTEGLYEQVGIGDRVKKDSGTTRAQLVESVNTSQDANPS